MQAWTFQSTRKAFSNFLAEIWARTTVNTSSLVFILLLLFLSPVQIFLQIWARQSTADAFNLLYAIDDYSDLPLAFEVLVPGGPLLSCFEIPPAGTSFETYCDTIWNNFLAVNQSSSFQAVETTVAAAKASTVFDDYVALARPTGPPSVLAGKERQRPNGNGKFGFGFRGDQDRNRPGGGRKQNGMGQGNNRASTTPSISQTSTVNQGMFFSSGIVSLPVGYIPETIVGQPNEPTVTAPSPLPTDTSSSTVFITVVLTGDSVVNVPTQLQLTASALPIATSVDSISQSTSSLPTSISTLTEGSSLSTALPVPTDGNGPQNLSQGKGKPGFGQDGSGRKKPTGVSTSRIRPSPSSNGTTKGGKNHFGTGRPLTSSGVGKGKNPFRPGAPQRRPTLKDKLTSSFPAPKKGLAAVFKPHAKRRPFGIRQAQNQTSGGSSPDADGDNDGDGADDDDDDVGDQDPDNDNYNYNYINSTFVVPFNGKNIILQPQFDQTQTNGSSSRRPRFLGMTLTGLHSAPFGTADVTFIAVPCIRGLVWAEQSLGHTLKECSLVMGFWAWIGVVGLLAVWIQSMSLMITSFIGLLISLLLLVFQLFENQFFEREYQRAVVNGVCGGVDVIETYPNMRPDLQFGAIGIAFVSMLLTGVCARFLVPIFGAEMRTKLEGLPALNRPYRLMITLKVLFELLSFIIPATAVMWLDSVFTSLPSAFSQDNELEEALFSSFAGFVIPWLMLGYEATRRSLCRTMIIFIVLTLPILAGWSAFFVVDLYRVWLVSWQFLAVLPVVAITLTTVVLVLGTIYRLDFKRGLPQLMGHCAPKDGSPVITTTQPDLERAASAGEKKVPDVGVQPKVQFDIPSTASAKSVEVEEGPSTDEGAVNNTELWTPKRARDAAPSAWTPGRLKGIFRNSGSTMTRDRARPSRTSSVFGPGPASIASFSGSGTAPPSSYLASIKNQPTSPHYTDSSVDLSDRGPRRTPRKTGLPNAPPRPARPPRLNLLRNSVWTEESSKESDAEAGPAAKQDVRTGIGPEGGLRVAGRFALGLK